MIRLAVRVAPGDAELVLADLLDFAPNGLEEVRRDDGRIEFALYGAPGELPTLPDLRAAVGRTLVEVVTAEVADDWAERWRDFHQPVEIAGRVHVRPPWADPAPPGLIDLAIDPAQAFGTGAHPTTRLCLELLVAADPNGSLLDVGCGSGVLAIAAAQLGFAPVTAVDHDPASIFATEQNARANQARLATTRIDLRRQSLPPADTVVANLIAALMLALVESLAATPRQIFVSGLLHQQVDDAVATLTAGHQELHETDRRVLGDWAAVVLTRA